MEAVCNGLPDLWTRVLKVELEFCKLVQRKCELHQIVCEFTVDRTMPDRLRTSVDDQVFVSVNMLNIQISVLF